MGRSDTPIFDVVLRALTNARDRRHIAAFFFTTDRSFAIPHTWNEERLYAFPSTHRNRIVIHLPRSKPASPVSFNGWFACPTRNNSDSGES